MHKSRDSGSDRHGGVEKLYECTSLETVGATDVVGLSGRAGTREKEGEREGEFEKQDCMM